MAKGFCESPMEDWIALDEITSTTETSSSAINLSAIPSTAKEVLVEMGWFYQNGKYSVKTAIIPYNQLLNIINVSWSYSANIPAYFVFRLSDGKITQFLPHGNISEVYTKVYYR